MPQRLSVDVTVTKKRIEKILFEFEVTNFDEFATSFVAIELTQY